jgi:hypothetical protein
LQEEHAVKIVQKKAKEERAKRTQRDAIFSERFASPEKVRMMRQANRSNSPEKQAILALESGLLPTPPEAPDRTTSPYRRGLKTRL